MSKAILKSLKPKTVANILNSNATLFISRDVRLYKATMKLIEKQGYATFFMYCTKDKETLVKNDIHKILEVETGKYKYGYGDEVLNGKIVAKFTLRKVEEIHESFEIDLGSPYYYENEECLEEQACLDKLGIQDYLDMKDGYAYHIEDLVIFDKPKELREFKRPNPSKNKHLDRYLPVKAPQNFCYVESEE